MKLSIPALILAVSLFCSNALAQLPDRLVLNFDQPGDYDPAEWLFVAPTPLGVTRADPDQTVSIIPGDPGTWSWSMQGENKVLVGINPAFDLTDSQVETTFDFVASDGISIGFLNRFGAVADPVDPENNPPLAHGYCTLVSPKTITLIDFDFARDPSDYIRPLTQFETPAGLFTGAETTVVFQTIDKPSSSDPNVTVPTFDFWLGGQQIFAGVEDPNSSWASGYSGVDVWTVDPFAEMVTDAFTVNFNSLAIRGVPEPSGIAFCSIPGLGLTLLRRRRSCRSRIDVRVEEN